MPKVRPLSKEHFPAVLKFADEHIGKNYYTPKDLERFLEISTKNNAVSSLLAFENETLVAMRISFAPGLWHEADAMETAPDKWPHEKETMGYFKSLFIARSHQGKGLGLKLSRKVLEIFKLQGAKGVVTHSWDQSPNNSSFKYLRKLGFEVVRPVPNAWSHLDYECVVCKPVRCHCSAKEMVLDLEKS